MAEFRTCPDTGFKIDLNADKLIKWNAVTAVVFLLVGGLFGLLVAMTPTVGVQMAIVFMIWLPIRYARPQWDFNVIIAMGWTWITNVFTLAPIYYVFLITGRIMLGSAGDLTGYDEFAALFEEILNTEAGIVEKLWIYTIELFRIWGFPMFVGSIPWALLSAWLGYRWSLRLVNRFRRRREQKAAARRALRQQR